MLRMESETGWWLITHPDHARLAGEFAAAWGNVQFRKPEPRERVLKGIACHDDGWATRDAHPSITRQGKPSAFSIELVGKYSAFEEIDIADYLAVRDQAVRTIAEQDPYAGLLISMHTYNLLTEHADRSTIAPEGSRALLDGVSRATTCISGRASRADSRPTPRCTPLEKAEQNDTRALPAFAGLRQSLAAHLRGLHVARPSAPSAPAQQRRQFTEVLVSPVGPRHFRLAPWPFPDSEMTFTFPARHVEGKIFPELSQALEEAFLAAHCRTPHCHANE
jgi:hypothetical protein